MTAPLSLISVLDTETTGFLPDASMVQVARTNIRLFPDGWAIEGQPVEHFVIPEHPISVGAMATHHILAEDCAGGLTQDQARRFATDGADLVSAHNWAFDKDFIGGPVPAICTLKGAREVWPEMESHANQRVRYELGLCLSREERAMAAHRAGFDTWVTAHILLELLKHRTVEQLVKISKLPSRLLKMPFGKHKGRKFSEIERDYLAWLIKSDMATDPAKADIIYSAKLALNGGI